MSTSSKGALGRVRYWWQAHPMVGLLVGWAVIATAAWRLWGAVYGPP